VEWTTAGVRYIRVCDQQTDDKDMDRLLGLSDAERTVAAERMLGSVKPPDCE
jgi:hypothetical protein